MKLHRAVVLAALILLSLALLGLMTAGAVSELGPRSLIALAVVLALAAAAGIAISWRRYFPGRS